MSRVPKGSVEANPERDFLTRLTPPLLITVIFLSGWELLGRLLEIRPAVLPTPSRIAMEVWHDRETLWKNGGMTAAEMLGGLALAAALAAALGIAAFRSPGALRAVERSTHYRRMLPMVAVVPVMLAWFGLGGFSRVVIACGFAVFALLQSVVDEIRSKPPEFWDWLLSVPAKPATALLKIHLPGSLPRLFPSLKAASVLALSGALIGELFGADRGLGYLLLLGTASSDTPFLLAVLCAVLAVAAAAVSIIGLAERLVIGRPVGFIDESESSAGISPDR